MKGSVRWIAIWVVMSWLPTGISFGAQASDAEADFKAGRYQDALQKATPRANNGDAAAQFILAAIYLNGLGVRPDKDVAIGWLTKSAEGNYAPAQSDLGGMYLTGQRVPQDVQRGKELLLKAAKSGEPSAFYDLGVMYRDGLGVSTDRAEAKRQFLVAAQKGHAPAQYAVARLLYDDGAFVDAAAWYEKAAAQGDLEALFNVGLMHHDGKGVPVDFKKANAYFLRAAEKGKCDQARRGSRPADMLGNSYRKGEGVDRDPIEAYKWYLLAAAQGHPSAPQQMRDLALTAEQITVARQRAEAFSRGTDGCGGISVVPSGTTASKTRPA